MKIDIMDKTTLGEEENRKLLIDENKQIIDNIRGLGYLLELSYPSETSIGSESKYISVWTDDSDVNTIKGKIIELINKL